MSEHWGVEDPAAVEGPIEECRVALHRAIRELDARIRRFLVLPIAPLIGSPNHAGGDQRHTAPEGVTRDGEP
jgi:hypothetical protein